MIDYHVIDLEKAVILAAEDVHRRISDLSKYREMAKNNRRLKLFLGVSYIVTAKWFEKNKKFNLEENLLGVGEKYLGVVLGLDGLSEMKFPVDNSQDIETISNVLYDDSFIKTLKSNSREIHEILTREINKPKIYF